MNVCRNEWREEKVKVCTYQCVEEKRTVKYTCYEQRQVACKATRTVRVCVPCETTVTCCKWVRREVAPVCAPACPTSCGNDCCNSGGFFSRLRDRARTIAAAAANGEGDKRAAEVAVLEALARDAAAAQTSLAQLVATAMSSDGAAPSTWSLPVRGAITQPFGPTTFPLEPARTFHGVYYAHFHDAVDIAALLGQPVLAAADGRVTFVGHLPDGAMVVLIAHPGGLVSVYAHLDDTFARPPVRIGDAVIGGQLIGFVGLTGITTGPHLHFAVLSGGQPIDPLSLLASH